MKYEPHQKKHKVNIHIRGIKRCRITSPLPTTLIPLVGKIMKVLMKLVKLMVTQKWKDVRRILQRKRIIICEQIEQFRNDLSLLSIACSHNAPHDIIEMLLSIDPESARLPDVHRMLPLHIACLVGAPSESIAVLLNYDLLAAKAVDDFDRTPLHYSVQFISEPMTASDAFESAGTETFSHSASASEVDSSIRSRRLGKGANASNQKSVSESGNSQVSMTISKFQDSLYTVHLLISACPDVIHFDDKEGRTPTDILQDSIANSSSNSRYERADITCKMLREKAVDIYMRQKKGWERDGNIEPIVATITESSGTESKRGSSHSITSGFTNLSKLEIDLTSLNQMDLLSDDGSS